MSLYGVLKAGVEVASVWAVHNGATDTQRGSPKWWFRDDLEAKEVAKGRGWWGGNAPVSEHKAIIVSDEEVYLLQQDEAVRFGGPENEQELRQKALGKLTDYERRLLGLPEAT